MSEGSAPTPDLLMIPVGEIRYRSSEPTLIPTTRLVKAEPSVEMAVWMAVISFWMVPAPDEAQRPRRRVTSWSMAAWKALMGELAVFGACEINVSECWGRLP